MQPVTLYSHQLGPNPWKVAIVLSALDIPYKTTFVDFTAIKQPSYTALNPNGRLPALTDPNTNLTLWESGAIIQYLIDTYDDDTQRLSYASFPERHLAQQWLHFQVSGQGPYYGQLGWFTRQTNHQEQVLAISRYKAEVRRVTSVLDTVLTGQEWLVGDKCTYADLAFVPWQDMLGLVMGEEAEKEFIAEFPNVRDWMERMKARPEVRRVLREKQEAMKEIMSQSR